MVRWLGLIEPGSVSNEIMHHMDWLPTYLAAAGRPQIKEELLEGITVEELGRDYKVHLDGYNFLPFLSGETTVSPRREVFYFTDDGDLPALRWADWKMIFLGQKAWATLRAWIEPFTALRVPLIFNPRRDHYTDMTYQPMVELLRYMRDEGFVTYIVSGGGVHFIRAFAEEAYGIPPRQVIGSQLESEYRVTGADAEIVKSPRIVFLDDKEGKPIAIDRIIGARPSLAGGNSNGDFAMLEWTMAGDGPRLGHRGHGARLVADLDRLAVVNSA